MNEPWHIGASLVDYTSIRVGAQLVFVPECKTIEYIRDKPWN